MSRMYSLPRCISLLLISAFGVALITGCGADDNTARERTLSKREYIARADELQGQVVEVFAALDGRLPANATQAATRVAALDDLSAGYELLIPPPDWRDEHKLLLESLAQMRQSILVVAKASASNRRAIEYQVGKYQAAQAQFQQAVDDINASR